MWAGNTNMVKNSHNLLSKYLTTCYFLLEALKNVRRWLMCIGGGYETVPVICRSWWEDDGSHLVKDFMIKSGIIYWRME